MPWAVIGNIKGSNGERGSEGPPGKLPLVRAYEPGAVHYEAQVVVTELGTFQAQRDTAHAPPHDDWLCLAAAGQDGRAPQPRGTYNAATAYRHLDIVALNGGSFVALKDDPGSCPGAGWQLLASQGKRGDRGEKGERGLAGPRGEPGEAGPAIIGWKTDPKAYTATPVMSDGSETMPLDMRGLFEQFLLETR
jgi:hypothetical protein